MISIEKATELKKQLDGLRPISKERESNIMQKFRLDWNYHSNHLEGNSLTFGETKALILFGITAQGKPLKDHFEITGHDEAIKWIIELIKGEFPLTETFIRELHTLLLKEPYEIDAKTPDGQITKKKVEIGKYKTTPNHVLTITDEIFRFASPEETPAMMNDLVKWYSEKIKSTDVNPILLSAEFHYRFIRIHPFDDGNGRVARILMNFILMKFGYPPVIIKTDDKSNYFFALRQADSGLIEPFIEYIAINLIHSLEIMISGAKGESIEEPDDLDKEITLLEQRVKSSGKKIEIKKTKESILDIYDNSIAKLSQAFIKSCEKFDKFYAHNQYYIYLNDRANNKDKYDAIARNGNNINNNTDTVALSYSFKAFNQVGFGEFIHYSRIDFTFGLTGYTIFVPNYSKIIEKLYSEQLTDEEINSIIKSEAKRHKDYIEQKLKEVQNKKT